MFPEIGESPSGWFIRENSTKMDDVGGNGNPHVPKIRETIVSESEVTLQKAEPYTFWETNILLCKISKSPCSIGKPTTHHPTQTSMTISAT